MYSLILLYSFLYIARDREEEKKIPKLQYIVALTEHYMVL